MKKLCISFFAFCTLAILTFTLVACSKPAPLELSEEQAVFYNSWLQNIKDDTPINKISILGSHDSGTSQMTSVIKQMTATQSLTIGEQLKYGCRYFDIRVNKKKNGELNIFHDIDTSGVNFFEIANDIVNFIKTNTSEFLVLDFQHFKNNSQKDVIEALKTTGIANYAIQNNSQAEDIDFVSSLTLSDMRGKVIIVWGSNEAYSEDYPFLFRRNNDSCTIDKAVLDSLYISSDNKKASDKFISETLPKYMEHIVQKEKGLTVLQGQLTSPSIGNLKKLEDGHNQSMSGYVREIENNQTNLQKINIIMRDFVGSDLEKSNSVLHINIAKSIVKDSAIANFEKLTKKQ